MAPRLEAERYAFVTLPDGERAQELAGYALASFREEEGWSLILPETVAMEHGLPLGPVQRRIVLTVHSSLEGVGLTAAVADAGIACNCVAAFHHDHIFVPSQDADRALALLQGLQASVRGERQHNR